MPYPYYHGNNEEAECREDPADELAQGYCRQPGLGRGSAYLLTFGVIAVAIGVTSAVSVMLPGSGG